MLKIEIPEWAWVALGMVVLCALGWFGAFDWLGGDGPVCVQDKLGTHCD